MPGEQQTDKLRQTPFLQPPRLALQLGRLSDATYGATAERNRPEGAVDFHALSPPLLEKPQILSVRAVQAGVPLLVSFWHAWAS